MNTTCETKLKIKFLISPLFTLWKYASFVLSDASLTLLGIWNRSCWSIPEIKFHNWITSRKKIKHHFKSCIPRVSRHSIASQSSTYIRNLMESWTSLKRENLPPPPLSEVNISDYNHRFLLLDTDVSWRWMQFMPHHIWITILRKKSCKRV